MSEQKSNKEKYAQGFYNSKISRKWELEANNLQAQLFFALGATDKGEVFLFWDNARGNEAILDYLKQVVAMLEKNKQKNFGNNEGRTD